MGYLFSGEYFNMFSIFEYKYLSKHMDRLRPGHPKIELKKTYDKEFGAVRTTFDQHSLFFSFFFQIRGDKSSY